MRNIDQGEGEREQTLGLAGIKRKRIVYFFRSRDQKFQQMIPQVQS